MTDSYPQLARISEDYCGLMGVLHSLNVRSNAQREIESSTSRVAYTLNPKMSD